MNAGSVERTLVAALAVAAGAAACGMAWHHPIAPALALGLAALWFALTTRHPDAWLFAIPALLPIADLSPWTGWIAVDEFDILLLATLAAGHARRAFQGERASPRTWLAIAAGLALFVAPALWRGLADAGLHFDWFDGYPDPVNSLRVAKSTVYALLLLPLIEGAMRRDPRRAGRRLAQGVVAGLVLFTVAIVWERAAYPGLFDTAEPYRTTGWFWEMHVGGAAIDGYLALASPFVAWALWSARGKRQWLAAALLALAVGYACLTTFSRGVYAAVLLPLLLLGGWLWARHWLSRLRWRTLASIGLIALIGLEALAVLAPESYMARRMDRTQRDYLGRLTHWRAGLALRTTAADRWLGIGLGRLPAHYAAAGARGEFSGATAWRADQGRGLVRIEGPRHRAGIGGLYGLTQQVAFSPTYRLQADLRTATGIELYARVCQSHLLYDAACQDLLLPVPRAADRWQRVDVVLPGEPFAPTGLGPWPGRGMVLTLSVVNPGGSAEIDRIGLIDAAGRDIARNGGFDHGPARWWPAAQFHFLPWHIDNLALELLIERGWLGVALATAALTLTLRRLLQRARERAPLAPFLAAALLGATIVGAVSSVLDAPRTAFLLCLFAAVAWALPRPAEPPPMP